MIAHARPPVEAHPQRSDSEKSPIVCLRIRRKGQRLHFREEDRANANVMACEMKVVVAFSIHPSESLDVLLLFVCFFRQRPKKNSNNQIEGLQRLIFLCQHTKIAKHDGLTEMLRRKKRESARTSAVFGVARIASNAKPPDLQFRVKSFSCSARQRFSPKHLSTIKDSFFREQIEQTEKTQKIICNH